MDKKNQKEFITALKTLTAQKGLSNDEIKEYLEKVFEKAFEKDGTFNTKDAVEVLEPFKIETKIDIVNGTIELWKVYEVVDKVENANEITHKITLKDPRINPELNLQVGDYFKEAIDLQNITSGKMQYIKQLLIQRTREAEKLKLYEQFHDKKGEIVSAKVYKIEENYIILDYHNVSIFMPRSETSPLDKFKINDFIKVFVIEVEKVSKDAQIIASRTNRNFVKKLIEEQIDDVSDKIINIERIVRVPGVKTKVVVSSNVEEVDPVGSIIGIKGKKIKPIIDELFGERIDVIKFSTDPKELITRAILPAKLEGIIEKTLRPQQIEEKNKRLRTNERDYRNNKEYILIVKKDNFLPALGKRGINVKLVANLVGANIDVRTVEDAKREGIKWEPIPKSVGYHSKNLKSKKLNLDDLNNYNLEDFEDMNDDYE